MEQNSQHSLIERAKQGQAAAIAELYRLYWPAARAAAYGVTAEMNLAEDTASEALLAAFSSLQTLEDTQCFSPWLRTIVVRTAKRLRNRLFKGRKTGSHLLKCRTEEIKIDIDHTQQWYTLLPKDKEFYKVIMTGDEYQ